MATEITKQTEQAPRPKECPYCDGMWFEHMGEHWDILHDEGCYQGDREPERVTLLRNRLEVDKWNQWAGGKATGSFHR